MPRSVLIVGAGPTGLTAAIELARRGIMPTVIERRTDPSPLSRAVGLMAGSIEIFARSGTDSPILDEAIRFTGMTIFDGRRRLARFPLNFDDRSRVWGLPQDRTEHHLGQTFARQGGEIRFGTSFSGLRETEDGVQVRMGDDEARFDLVVGADGAHSDVRAAIGIPYEGVDLPGLWSIADVDCTDWPDPTGFRGFLLREGHVAVVVPMATDRYRVIASRPEALAALPVPMPVTRIRRRGAFTIPVRQVPRYGTARVFLAGDAAHAHSPVGGRGMNLGIADAADLARRIAEDDLAGYSAARHAEGARVIAFSERGRRMLQSRNPLRRETVKLALRIVGRVDPLSRAGMRYFVNA